ncbi:hypothetical protein Nepgr_026878 [Nepenthes gracilis]|uniref:FRIGIDA-like protein n=1 Tax=Nepenthes gracilis TaxID=150966 RepID=A0AAD3Y2F8_NEPGR|nr:hypothetical protein Nepgr_026878 [Nepenthes gracilis]
MATLQAISEAVKQIDAKKKNLEKAFKDLQSHSHSLSSFPLNWSDIDSYFSNIQSSLQSEVYHLQQREQSQNPQFAIPQKTPNSEENDDETPIITPEIDVKEMCERMEAEKLRNWLMNVKKWRIGAISSGALNFAPDPCKLVLDAIDGSPGHEFRDDAYGVRTCLFGDRNCLLLEALMAIEGVNISGEMRERARTLAMEWKGKMKKDKHMVCEAMLILRLLACFRLGAEFDQDELADFVVLSLTVRKHFSQLKFEFNLCLELGLQDKFPEIVRRVSNMGRQLQAAKSIYELKLADKCPIVPILRSYVNDAQKQARLARKQAKRLQATGTSRSEEEATELLGKTSDRQLNMLRVVLKLIKEYNLESDYPIDEIESRITDLEQKIKRKHAADAQAPNPKKKKQKQQRNGREPKMQKRWQLQQQNGSEHALTSVPAASASFPAVSTTMHPPFQQSHFHPANFGSLVERPAEILSSPAGMSYGSAAAGSAAEIGLYMGRYGLPITRMGYAANQGAIESHFFASGSDLPAGVRNFPAPFTGYGVPPQYDPHFQR